jgi:hypothetical protein
LQGPQNGNHPEVDGIVDKHVHGGGQGGRGGCDHEDELASVERELHD